MIARISKTLLLAACALWPSVLSAQWAASGEQPSMIGYPPPGQYAPPGGPSPFGDGYAPQAGMDYYGDGSSFGEYCPPEAMPWDREGNSPFRAFLREVMPNTYFQVEYLSWSIDDIGSGAVGTGTLLTEDVRNPIPFGLFDTETFVGQDFFVPRTGSVSFEKLSGARVTFGVPLTIGTFEANLFGLEDGEAGVLNSVPGIFATIRPFQVPSNTAFTVPPAITSLTFPIGATIVALPGQPIRLITPPLVPTVPIALPVQFGDILAPNLIFNAASASAAAIPLLQNGRPSTTVLIYDVAYAASSHNELFGGEAKMVLDMGPNHNGLTVKPLVGFRYMSFDESFRQTGVSSLGNNVLRGGNTLFVANDPFFLPVNQPGVTRGPLFTSTIHSEAENTLYGLQVGTRAEYNHKWFTLGVEPKISLGMNNYEAEVVTRNLRGLSDGTVRTAEDDLIFAPVFDVSMYGRLHMTPYFSLHAGYNFTYLSRVTRPHDNIYYNDNGPFAAPGVVVNADTQDMHIRGLTVGGEFRFRDLKFRR